MKSYLENYIDYLIENQNSGCSLEQRNLFSKKDYYEILKPVVELLKEYKDYSINELRKKLFDNSNIEKMVKDFIYSKEMSPGMVFSYGTKNYKETIIVGNKSEVTCDSNGNIVSNVQKMTEDTIFDLASVTKLFTGLSILILVQNGIINLNDEIIDYEPRFKNLKGITIFDLLCFKTPIKTDKRIDDSISFEEAEDTLFTLYVDKNYKFGNSLYTDMGAIVLKYVIERASGMNFYEFIKENILKKSEMNDTHVLVPDNKLNRVVSTNLGSIYSKDGDIIDFKYIKEGYAHDPKARILGQTNGILSGHAGLFSTAEDMTNLCKGLIDGIMLDRKYLQMLAKNRTGTKYYTEEGKIKYTQYFGFMCYTKNPILEDSELFHAMSGKSFASAGYTGTQLTVDPINQIYLFLGSNRTHNRVSVVDPSQRCNIKYDENGKGTIILQNGNVKSVNYRFAWDKDSTIIHPTLKLAIQYKMLEDIMNYSNEKEKVNVIEL